MTLTEFAPDVLVPGGEKVLVIVLELNTPFGCQNADLLLWAVIAPVAFGISDIDKV